MMIRCVEPLSRYHFSNVLPQAAIEVIALGFYQYEYRGFNLKLFGRAANQEVADSVERSFLT